MFKKIVSNLPFSPSLVRELGQYYKHLQKETKIRRLSLILLGLTIVLQLIVISQPEFINDSNNNFSFNNVQYQDNLSRSIYSINTSKGYIDSQSAQAESGDQIAFTIVVENKSDSTITTNLNINLIDILEYSAISDDGGGSLNSNGYLSWGETDILANSKQTRVFAVKVLDDIPTTPTDTNNANSFDCTLSTKFGSPISISLSCPVVKSIERILSKLPKFDRSLSLVLMLLVTSIAGLLYFRTKLFKTEIQLIRKDIGNGTIIDYEEEKKNDK